eukprot:g82002.t1
MLWELLVLVRYAWVCSVRGRIAMRSFRVASAFWLRSSHTYSLHSRFPVSAASLPQRSLSSRRASVPKPKRVMIDLRGKSAEEILELWSSGKLEVSHAVTAFFLLDKAVRGQQRPLTKLSRSDPAFVDLVAALRLQLPSLRGKDLSNVWLGARDSKVGDLEFLEELGKVAQQKAASLDAQAIANILNSMTNLQYNPGEAVLRTLCGEALKKADSFDAQGLANTLNAFAKLDHQPGEAVLRALCGEALKKADSFNAQEIANTLNAFAKLDHQPGEAVLRTLCGEALKNVNLFKAQEIANTLNAFAKLDHQPGEAVQRTLCGEALKKADSFDAQEIANTLHACVVLDRVDPALFSSLIAQLFQFRVMLNPVEMRQLHYVHLSLRWEHPSMGLVLPASLADACKLSLMSEPVESSRLHKEVSSVLQAEGLPHDNEKNASGLCKDICLNEQSSSSRWTGPLIL